MKTYITKTDAEAKGLHDGTVTEIVIALDPQPVNGPPRRWNPNTHAVTWKHHDDAGLPVMKRREVAPGLLRLCAGSPEAFAVSVVGYSPYAPGDRIAVKERWRVAALHNTKGWYIQYADGTYVYIADWEPSYKPAGEWCPAHKMKLAWRRTHLLCEAVEAKQVDGRWCFVCQVKKEP